jgi:hypothetical protein
MPQGVDREKLRRVAAYALAHPEFMALAHRPELVARAFERAGPDLLAATGGPLSREEAAYIAGYAELASARLSPDELEAELARFRDPSDPVAGA